MSLLGHIIHIMFQIFKCSLGQESSKTLKQKKLPPKEDAKLKIKLGGWKSIQCWCSILHVWIRCVCSCFLIKQLSLYIAHATRYSFNKCFNDWSFSFFDFGKYCYKWEWRTYILEKNSWLLLFLIEVSSWSIDNGFTNAWIPFTSHELKLGHFSCGNGNGSYVSWPLVFVCLYICSPFLSCGKLRFCLRKFRDKVRVSFLESHVIDIKLFVPIVGRWIGVLLALCIA